MLAHVALVAVQVEVGMVGQVDRTRLIDRRTVFNGDSVVVGQREARGRDKIPREALIAIQRIQ